MVIKSVGGIKIQGQDPRLVKKINSLLKKMNQQTYFREIPFEELSKIVILRNEMDLMLAAYREKQKGAPFIKKYQVGLQGMYSPQSRTIYLMEPGSSEVIDYYWQWDAVFLHEFSHFLSDRLGFFSFDRYSEDNRYRCLEEIRVTNMATYLAKRIMTHPEKIREVQRYAGVYNGIYRELLRKIDFMEKLRYHREEKTSVVGKWGETTSGGGSGTWTITVNT